VGTLSVQQILTSAANSAGIPPALLLAQAKQESGLNPSAYNAKSGATGLLQLEPATAAQLGVSNPLDAQQNAQGGATYLAQLYNQFGSWDLALAAYDWGPGNLQNALQKYGSNWLSYAPAETQNYVSSVLSGAGMDATASVTPASIVSGAVQSVQDLFTPSDDSGDSNMPDVSTGTPGLNVGTVVLVAGVALGAYFLADVLADF
jgi:hypothetical protein